MPEPSVHDEAREIVRAAREILVELDEEGVDAIVPADLPELEIEPVAAAEPTPARPTPAAASPAPQQREADRGVGRDRPTDGVPAAPESESAPSIHVPQWGAEPTLAQVQEELGDCRRCGLCEGRSTIVFGSGNPNADLMFIGEGPGAQEDQQGLPFVGPAGELLTQMIEKGIETPRADVYICNIVKCRPPNNRNPLPNEVSACRPFLDGQIDAVRPKVIVSLGKPAASLLLGRNVAITRERGTWQRYRGIPLMPTLHPAFILRQYTPENRRMVWEDLKQAIAKVNEG